MRYRTIPFAFAISVLLSLVAFAQTQQPQPRATQPAKAASAEGIGAQGKIAIINYAAFRVGIGELKLKLEVLNKEFEGPSKELEGLQKEINELKTKVQTQDPKVQPAALNKLMERGAELEKALKRKSEDYQSLFQKRSYELTAPVFEKINSFLSKYIQQHNIVLVLEGEVIRSSNLLVMAAPAAEITDDFIKEYNKANPPSAPAAPRK